MFFASSTYQGQTGCAIAQSDQNHCGEDEKHTRPVLPNRCIAKIQASWPYNFYHAQKFQLLIKTKMLKNKDFSCFQTIRFCIVHANKC